MATLKVINNISLATSTGATVTAKQGSSSDASTTAFDVTVTGTTHARDGSLATATAATIYDSTADLPATFDHGYFWSDQACQIQLVTSATNVTTDVIAKVPYVFTGKILGAADDDNISAAATTTAIDEITLWNGSGSTMNYRLVIVD